MRLRRTVYIVVLAFSFLWFLYGLNLSTRSPKYNLHLLQDTRSYNTNGSIQERILTLGSGPVTHSSLRVFYNRVPKCGSRSALTLFKTLSVKNGFKLFNPATNYPYALEEQDQKQLTNFIASLTPPLLYHRHVHYMNISRLGGPPVIYINLIRDPLSRAVSHFYFRRHGDGILGKSRLGKPINNTNTTFDECVLKQHRECLGNWVRFFVVPFFCGHTHQCRSASRRALEQAKQHVVNNYLVVGVVEEFDDFIKVLERLLPSFFRGAYATWKSPGTKLNPKALSSQTRNKKQPSEKVISIVKKRMQLEYEFYDFIKERFHALKKELDI